MCVAGTANSHTGNTVSPARAWATCRLSMRYGGGCVDGLPTVMTNCAPAGATSTGTMRWARLPALYTRSPKSPAASICAGFGAVRT